jgi:parvulin-like peptidyl-prolyl isomerase
MLRYYYEHQPEFSSKPKVKWEELMISRSRIPDAQAARNAVAKLGNEVIVGRRSFADVARAGSHGVTADKGGLHDWTTQGSLVSEVLDHALFSIELGRMSKILEDKDGFHIIRVVDRTPGGVTPFRQAQVEIREKLRKEKSAKAIVDYLARIRETTQIWTIFDGDPSGALPGR